MTKDPRSETRAIGRDMRDRLAERFPQCFAGWGKPKRPLKRHIHVDIRRAMPDVPAKHISYALYDYTGGPTYLRSVLEGATRIDLDGQPAGVVNASQARHAEGCLRRLALAWERRKHKEHHDGSVPGDG